MHLWLRLFETFNNHKNIILKLMSTYFKDKLPINTKTEFFGAYTVKDLEAR